MTKRERHLTTRLIDFLDNELGVVDYGPTYKFFASSKKMLQRWLDRDARADECLRRKAERQVQLWVERNMKRAPDPEDAARMARKRRSR